MLLTGAARRGPSAGLRCGLCSHGRGPVFDHLRGWERPAPSLKFRELASCQACRGRRESQGLDRSVLELG